MANKNPKFQMVPECRLNQCIKFIHKICKLKSMKFIILKVKCYPNWKSKSACIVRIVAEFIILKPLLMGDFFDMSVTDAIEVSSNHQIFSLSLTFRPVWVRYLRM